MNKINWTDARRGDSALVISENKMGVILKDYGRKFHLRFADGSEKTYDASELTFFNTDEDYKRGGKIKKGDTWEWHTVEYDHKRGNNFKVIKKVEIVDINSKGEVTGRIVGTSNKFIIRDPQKYLKLKVSKMENGGNMKNTHMLEDDGKMANGGVVPSNIEEFAKRKGVYPLVKKVAGWAEKVGARIAGGTAIGKYYDTLVLDLNYEQEGEIRIDTVNDTVKLFDKYVNSFSEFKKIYSENTDNKMENGGVIGQEIVFDDNGEENTGVIKDIHEITGNYIVLTNDGRTVLADKELDVISLGKMREIPQAKKRFSFFKHGGKMVKGGNLDSKSLFDLEYGDVFKIDRNPQRPHTMTGQYFLFIGFSEKFAKPEGVTIEAAYFPGSFYGPEYDQYNQHTYLSGLKNGDITMISKEEAAEMLMDYYTRNEKFKFGGKMVRGGKTNSTELFDLEYGDVFKITKRAHNLSNETFVFIRLQDFTGPVLIQAKRFPSLDDTSTLYKWESPTVNIGDIKDGDIEILSKVEAGKMLMDYNLRNNKFKDGGNIEKENKEMLHSQTVEARHHVDELAKILTSKNKIEPWVVARMERATTDLSDVTHYLEGKKMATGGGVGKEQTDIDKIKKKLDALGVKYEMSKTDKVRSFKVIYKPVNKSDEFYDKFDDIVDLANLKDVVKLKMATGGGVDDVIYEDKTLKIVKTFKGVPKEYKEFDIIVGNKTYYCDVYTNGDIPERYINKLERIFRKKYPSIWKDYDEAFAKGGKMTGWKHKA